MGDRGRKGEDKARTKSGRDDGKTTRGKRWKGKGRTRKGRESKKIDSDTDASKHRRNRTDHICTQTPQNT